jgi:hypothetical protein
MKRADVYIDGIKYVPHTEVLIDEKKFVKALLEQFWGVVSDEDYDNLMDLRVVVSDGFPDSEGESIRELIERLSEVSE